MQTDIKAMRQSIDNLTVAIDGLPALAKALKESK
jgi:hypothetical protein